MTRVFYPAYTKTQIGLNMSTYQDNEAERAGIIGPPIPMTPEYRYIVNNKGTRCPYCESADINAPDHPDVRGAFENSLAKACKCDECGRSWTDIYTLTGIEEDSE